MYQTEFVRKVDISLLKSPAIQMLLVIGLLLFGEYLAAETGDCSRTMEITSASIHVISYPLLISLETCNLDYEYGVVAYASDLGTPHGRKSPVQFQLSKKGHPDEFIVFGKKRGDLHDPTPRAPQVLLQENSCISTTVDLFQNMAVRGYDRAIDPGTWVLRACEAGFLNSSTEPFCSNEIEITVVEPTEAEAQIAEVFRKNPSWRSWFPMAAVSGEAISVDTSDFRLETRRLLELIQILRHALDSGEQCLFATGEAEANGLEWGPISSLIASIQYECALETGNEKAAAAASKNMSDGTSGDLATARIKNGDGLISNLKRYKNLRAKH